jgi:alkylhydroperoxidase/carboxymuconolactone decarboxylase family protein YurZ
MARCRTARAYPPPGVIRAPATLLKTQRHLPSAGSAPTGFRSETQMADTESPVADTLAMMTAISIENSGLPDRELMLARIAALVAVDAPPASYVMNAGAAVDAGVTLEDVQSLLVAVAPIVGTVRVLSASVNLAKGIGFAIDLIEAELEAEEADQS